MLAQVQAEKLVKAREAYRRLVDSGEPPEDLVKMAFWLGAVMAFREAVNGFAVPELEWYFLRLQRVTGRELLEEWKSITN